MIGAKFQPPGNHAVARFRQLGRYRLSHAAFDHKTGIYIVNASELGSAEMIKKPDGSYDMRYGYQWGQTGHHISCQNPPWGNLYGINQHRPIA